MRKHISFFTYSGTQLDLNNFDASRISIDEVAQGLSHLCRYNGQVNQYYSVAEHSVLLCDYFAEQGATDVIQKYALMHDCAEAFVGDIVHHLKPVIKGFKEVEDDILNKLLDHFNIFPSLEVQEIVHKADRCICVDEMYQLMSDIDPDLLSTGHQPLHIVIENFSPFNAKRHFLDRAKRLDLC